MFVDKCTTNCMSCLPDFRGFFYYGINMTKVQVNCWLRNRLKVCTNTGKLVPEKRANGVQQNS